MDEKKEKFTPGPWKWEARCFEVGKIFRFGFQILGGGHRVCYSECNRMEVVETMEANARLISAAPEMYELLDCIRKSVALDAGIMASCIARIEPLLKKARGEANEL